MVILFIQSILEFLHYAFDVLAIFHFLSPSSPKFIQIDCFSHRVLDGNFQKEENNENSLFVSTSFLHCCSLQKCLFMYLGCFEDTYEEVEWVVEKKNMKVNRRKTWILTVTIVNNTRLWLVSTMTQKNRIQIKFHLHVSTELKFGWSLGGKKENKNYFFGKERKRKFFNKVW